MSAAVIASRSQDPQSRSWCWDERLRMSSTSWTVDAVKRPWFMQGIFSVFTVEGLYEASILDGYWDGWSIVYTFPDYQIATSVVRG